MRQPGHTHAPGCSSRFIACHRRSEILRCDGFQVEQKANVLKKERAVAYRAE
jgi:hypothetical protein